MVRKVLLVSCLVFVAALVGIFYATAPSDEELIERALEEAIVASKEGKPGGVLEHLSRSFVYDGQPVFDWSKVSQYIKVAKPVLEVDANRPQIDGDQAIIVAHIEFKMGFQALSFDESIDNVEIRFGKESGTRWLIFPSPQWKITEVSTPESGELPSFAQ
ncbi:MAG: hypothetical protein IH944_06200 [Armatimonadetes bacterium]|nr:hypothetical protein [Armatimonadota bacterium]